MDSLPSRLFISLVLLVLAAVVRAFREACGRANEEKLEAGIGTRAKRALYLVSHRRKTRGAANLAVILCIAAQSAVVCEGLHFVIEGHNTLALVLSLLCMAAVYALFGFCFPDKLGRIKADTVCVSLSGIMRIIVGVLGPADAAFGFLSDMLLRLLRINPESKIDNVTEEEILKLVDIGSSSGAIDPEEKEMINNIFEFDDTPAKDIMTHRTDVEFLWEEDGIDEWYKVMSETNHSIYPVCGENVDNIIGILVSKDFYRALHEEETPDVKKLLKTPFFVPDSIKADDLFRSMQKNKTHFAVVLDEYGGLGGIITISDLLEEIVGTLSNDGDETEEEIVQLDSNTWRVAGSAEIETVSEALGVKLPLEEYNTFAGMILGELGTIPEDGTTPELEAYGLAIRVLRIEDHRIEEAKVSVIDPDKPE